MTETLRVRVVEFSDRAAAHVWMDEIEAQVVAEREAASV
jgi:hypothetical protein